MADASIPTERRSLWDSIKPYLEKESLAAFFVGGLVGALGFKHAGFLSTVPLACLLVLLGVVPATDDALGGLRRRRGR